MSGPRGPHAPVFPGDRIEHRVPSSRAGEDTAVLAGEPGVAPRPPLRVRRIVVARRRAAELEGVG